MEFNTEYHVLLLVFFQWCCYICPKTVVQENLCPGNICPRDICLRRLLSNKKLVQGDFVHGATFDCTYHLFCLILASLYGSCNSQIIKISAICSSNSCPNIQTSKPRLSNWTIEKEIFCNSWEMDSNCFVDSNIKKVKCVCMCLSKIWGGHAA